MFNLFKKEENGYILIFSHEDSEEVKKFIEESQLEKYRIEKVSEAFSFLISDNSE